MSVADALAAGQPFVVTFATPLYCQSRTCGPVVDVVSAVRKKLASTGVRFIHVEIYEGNDPANGVNRWVDEWKLPTEPFTFVVDRKGVVRTKLEGAFSTAELERAVRQVVSTSRFPAAVRAPVCLAASETGRRVEPSITLSPCRGS